MKKRKPVKRNPVARVLADQMFRKRIVKSKKLYTRKGVKAPKNALTFFVSVV